MIETEMSQTGAPAITRRTNGWGIDLNYEDALGEWHETPQETISAILHAMGADENTLTAPQDDCVMIIRKGEQRPLPACATITLETGETVRCETRLPADLPIGYHALHFESPSDAKPARLIVTPGTCWLPEHLQTWGWAVQLYAARSRESWGMGDFADLDRLAAWSANDLGAGMMLVNPLSAATPITPQQESPYYPTSRCFFNPLWLHIPWVPGADYERIPQLKEIERQACALNEERLIDRDKIFQLKMQALDLLWLDFPGDPAFDAFCLEHGADLESFARFCALAEHHKSGWHNWPEQYRHPSLPGVAEFAREHQGRVRFHKWLQWLLDTQLARCADRLALMQDLPIGCDPDGADAWAWQDYIAKGMGVGAPPDEFNTQGQDWGLPPFVPWKLRAAGYQPFIQIIRAAFRHCGGLRIDHVMGLFRLFWIPNGVTAAKGAYVRYNPDELLAIVALESERAKAYVVGEDLGTVEEGAREKLAEHCIMSYRLLWFEKDAPETYPREALSALTTHDLPTVAGLWTGSDLDKQHQLGLKPNEEGTAEIVERLKTCAELASDDPIEEVVAGAYQLLSKAPSRILTAALDDALCVEERPNVPATMSDKNPNWSLALPKKIEELMEAELPKRIANALKRGGTGHSPLVTAAN